MPSPTMSSTDFSCRVTIINNSNQTLDSMTQRIEYGGGFSPLPPSTIGSQNTPSPSYVANFSLLDSDFSGSGGSVTYDFAPSVGSITFSFSCPKLSANTAACTQTTTNVGVLFYGSTTPVQWDEPGTNWGSENEVPSGGRPLYLLFVLESLS